MSHVSVTSCLACQDEFDTLDAERPDLDIADDSVRAVLKEARGRTNQPRGGWGGGIAKLAATWGKHQRACCFPSSQAALAHSVDVAPAWGRVLSQVA